MTGAAAGSAADSPAGADGPAARHVVTWRAAPRLRRLAAVAVIAIAAAVLTRHAGLLLLAAPPLAVLAAAGHRRRPASIEAGLIVSAARCFEGEDLEVSAAAAPGTGETWFTLTPAAAMSLVSGSPAQVVTSRARPGARWVLRPATWGRLAPCTVTVSCRAGGLWQADLALTAAAVEVFPHPPPVRTSLLPPTLLRRLGEHTGRIPGGGAEFAGIREYQPGDRLRDVNWPVTSRRGRLHVNQRAAERAADLVVMVDAFSEVGPAGDTTLELAVRGAAGLADAYLRSGDRVGAVALGGMLRWLAPAAGHLHFYRVAELAIDARHESVVTPDLTRIPRPALPPGCLAVLFSPLLDERVLTAITDLRARGVWLVVVDVLRHEPPPEPRAPLAGLALRLWRLDRRAQRASLARLGVPVLSWERGSELDTVITPLRGRPLPAARSPAGRP
ncbi:MAG: DUF58 domain-containing protein [Actinobacteria bacterium]|nr:DUF58 domain-containing protein [Actinomycetota bacterium]